ncbi:MAG: hypothetical protein JJU02_07310 [Cryomorphaceae bacterium]|nr:hypothetical protein [Cryomorphaceae bacterium]
MKKIILSILTLLAFVLIASACNKRVDCLCTNTPTDPNSNAEPNEIIVTLPDGGDCEEDVSGPFYDKNGEPFMAVCEEIIDDDQFNGEPEDGE